MRRILILPLILASFPLFSQLNIGFKLGAGSGSVPAQELSITDQAGQNRFRIALEEAGYSIHGGLVIQLKLGKAVLFQPEILLQTDRIDYRATDLEKPGDPAQLLTEKYQHLNIPVLLGFKAGPLRFQGGPQGHLYLSSRSGLDGLDGYAPSFTKSSYSWLAGAGLDIWKTLMIDIRYEGRISEQRDHFTFYGQGQPLRQQPYRLLASVGILLGKKK